MTQPKTLTLKDSSSNRTVNNLLGVIPVAALLMALPLPAQAGAPAATSASAATATPTSRTAPPPASEEVPLPQSHVPPFAQVDTNHDGKIEWKEAQAVKVPKKVFDQFDFDHDGSLSETEWLFVRLHMTDFAPPKATTKAPVTATK